MKNISACPARLVSTLPTPPKNKTKQKLKIYVFIYHLPITTLNNQMDHLDQQFEACSDRSQNYPLKRKSALIVSNRW